MPRNFKALVFLFFFVSTFLLQARAQLQAQLQASTSRESSTERILAGVNAQGEKVYLVLYLEGRVWRVEEVLQRTDGWQDLISRHQFRSRTEAEKFQIQLQKRHGPYRVLSPHFLAGLEPQVLRGGVLWPTTQTWSWEWEKKYSQWLTENMDAEFFKKHNIATDCADVAYAARWIFARIHGLPVANRLSGSGSLMTNLSLRAEWEKLPTAKNWSEDRRFRAALNYLLNMTYTHTLMRDSYPVAITPENFLPGVHHLDLHESSGHTQLVHRVDLTDSGLVPYLIIQSTVPRQVRLLNESLFWGRDLGTKGKSAFLRILWPQINGGTYSLAKPESMPGYSLEQFEPGFIREGRQNLMLEILLRLKPHLRVVGLFDSGYKNLKEMFKARVPLVEEGYRQCSTQSCPPESALYDAWSTPSRDRKILEIIRQLDMLFWLPFSDTEKREVLEMMEREKNTVVVSHGGLDYTLKMLDFIWKQGMFSSDPNDGPELRWGGSPQAFAQRLSHDLQKLLQARKSKITVEGDRQLREALYKANQYCLFFSDENCQHFKDHELLRSLKIGGLEKPLRTWLEDTLWLNSDPRQSFENQWGALRSKSKFQIIPAEAKTFFVTKKGIGYMALNSGATKVGPMGTQGLQERPLPPGFRWKTLDRETSVAWALAEGKILREDFSSKGAQVFNLPFTFKGEAQILRAIGSHLLLKSMDTVWSLEIQEGRLLTRWQGAVTGPDRMEEDVFYLGRSNQGWQIFNFATKVPQIVPVTESLENAKIFKITDRFIGLTAQTKSFFVEKATGRIRDVSHLSQAVMWSPGLTKAILPPSPQNGVYRQVTLDSNFQIVASEDLFLWGNVQGDYLFCFDEGGVSSLYQRKGEELVKIPLLPDEDMMTGFTAPWSLVNLKGRQGRYRLRHLSGRPVIYEGEEYFQLIPGQKNPEWAVAGNVGELSMRLVALKNLQAPAWMTGEFQFMIFPENVQSSQDLSADRGLLLSVQNFNFWVEFY